MMNLVISVLLLFLAYYLLFLWNVWRGLSSENRYFSSAEPSLSVIVAARNEEQNIQQCVQALAHQEYNRDKFEIIIVDDHSRDRTLDLARKAAQVPETPAMKLISLSDDPGEFGKPVAIARGVEIAKGEIILCTDADCTPPPRWMRSMIACFDPSVAFVAGPVLEGASSSIFSGIQRLEFLGLITAAAGLIGSGKPIICNGANIGYRKAAFQKVNGFGIPASSCDDETVMQRILRRDVGKVVFNTDPEATVVTTTPSSPAEFLKQRIRWASKRGHFEDKMIVVRLVGLYMFFLILLLSMLIAVIDPFLRLPVLSILLTKALAELAVLMKGARLFRQKVDIMQFLVAQVFHVPYIVFAAMIGQISSLRWKDREFAT